MTKRGEINHMGANDEAKKRESLDHRDSPLPPSSILSFGEYCREGIAWRVNRMPIRIFRDRTVCDRRGRRGETLEATGETGEAGVALHWTGSGEQTVMTSDVELPVWLKVIVTEHQNDRKRQTESSDLRFTLRFTLIKGFGRGDRYPDRRISGLDSPEGRRLAALAESVVFDSVRRRLAVWSWLEWFRDQSDASGAGAKAKSNESSSASGEKKP